MESIPLQDTLTILALAISGLTVLAFMMVSAVLAYHWNRYEVHKDNVRRLRLIYWVVSLVLLVFVFSTMMQVFA